MVYFFFMGVKMNTRSLGAGYESWFGNRVAVGKFRAVTKHRVMTLGTIGSLLLSVCADKALATEPGSFTNIVSGATVGVPIAAAPPPGLYFNNSFVYIADPHGQGNAGCGPGCTTRYNGVADTVSFTWATGWKFLGADYFPTIGTQAYSANVTSTAPPPGGGFLASPLYNETQLAQLGNIYVNPINFSRKVGDTPLFLNAGLGFVAPTGTTYNGALLPDYWTIRPHAAVTYLGNDLNLTASLNYDINTNSQGKTGLYQIIALGPTTPPGTSAFLTGPANPGRGYNSGDLLSLDLTATKRFGKWEVGGIAFLRYQTTNDTPGGINPATNAAWTCTQLTAAGLPSCGRDVDIGAGLLVGYNFGPVDMKLIYQNGFFTKDSIDANAGSRIWLKTSFRLWAPDEDPPAKKSYFTKN
jgi:hypothetical protein